MTSTLAMENTGFVRQVEQRSGAKVSACLQCHKCSTGCPVGPEMDLLPSQVMRLVVLGEERETLGLRSIWLCASCEACTTRCPMEIDIAAVMDTLRMMAVERRAADARARSRDFNRAFLTSVRWHARVFEMGMMVLYKLRSGDLFADIGKVPKMLVKGKLSLLPHFSSAAREVRKVFERAEEEERRR